MSNDKTTLADVQPGGRVKLGDQALSISEGARRYVADYFATQLSRHDFGDYILTELAADFACALAQHLSAHPSPGGQDALAALQQDYDKLLDSFNRQVEVAEKIAGRVLQQDDRIEELEEALAARQPVGSEEAHILPPLANERMLDAGWPYGEVINGKFDRQGAYADLLSAAPPAQAVGLDAARALLQRRIEQWRSHLPADPDAPGTREIETKSEHDYSNDVRIYREGIAVMEEVLAMTDSQAVGNG